MEIRDINKNVNGTLIGDIAMDGGVILRCYEIHQTRTMQLYGVAYNNGKMVYSEELQDFRLNITSIRIQVVDNEKVVETREFLTSICNDESARKAFKAISELKHNLIDKNYGYIALSMVEDILDEINLPYIKNTLGSAKTYFRSVLRASNSHVLKIPPKSLTFKFVGVDSFAHLLLEEVAATTSNNSK